MSFFKREKKESKPAANSSPNIELPYKKGNFIGRKYEVYTVLGKGGFGVVYLGILLLFFPDEVGHRLSSNSSSV